MHRCGRGKVYKIECGMIGLITIIGNHSGFGPGLDPAHPNVTHKAKGAGESLVSHRTPHLYAHNATTSALPLMSPLRNSNIEPTPLFPRASAPRPQAHPRLGSNDAKKNATGLHENLPSFLAHDRRYLAPASSSGDGCWSACKLAGGFSEGIASRKSIL